MNFRDIGTGTPLLVLHGGKLDHRHMVDALEPSFERQSEWRRLYLDLPGHGLSDASETVSTQDDVLDILIEFTEKILPDQRFAVIGESRGSYLARGITHKKPTEVCGMMLIVPGDFGTESAKHLPPHQTMVTADDLRSDLAPEEIARFDRLVIQNAEILDKIRRTKIPASALHDTAMEARINDHFEFSFDLGTPQTTFTDPCLILSGRQDAIAGYRDAIEMLAHYPRASFALLDHAGHSLAWEQPELFHALMKDWLKRVQYGLDAEK
ncbi:MAG: alpha/beta hydrolase [Alphaproteobacteria bacterium]|nr:MAG: alpha/beta hydrolase [Alphaproteobacteria bacterium]